MFSEKDIESISRTVQQMHDIVQRGKDNYSPQLSILLEARLEVCRVQLSHLHDHLSHLSPELAPIHEKLISILRSISAANTRTKVYLLGISSSTHLTHLIVPNRGS
jgi:hypothetical protein